MKYFIAGFLLIAVTLSYTFSQSKRHNFESLLSIKAGYHTAYTHGIGIASISNANIPHGFSADINAEIHTGKNWYIGFNYDLSFGNETAYDQYLQRNIERSFTIHQYSPIVKYRFPLKKGNIYTALGIGGSKVYASYGNSGSHIDVLVMYNLRAGGEYYLNNWAMLSLETVFIEAGEIDFGGGGRNYRFFQFKTGIVFILK